MSLRNYKFNLISPSFWIGMKDGVLLVMLKFELAADPYCCQSDPETWAEHRHHKTRML